MPVRFGKRSSHPKDVGVGEEGEDSPLRREGGKGLRVRERRGGRERKAERKSRGL